MHFTESEIQGIWIVDIDRHADERGYFARTYCEREFRAHDLCTQWVQVNQSYNRLKGTIRGLHFQSPPHDEAKLVQCLHGAIYDVVLDLRPESQTYLQWRSFELTSENCRSLYIPTGIAHGYQTLTDDAHLFYMMSTWHDANSARGVRWNDEAFKIQWPLPVCAISQKDRALPRYRVASCSSCDK